MKLKRYSQLLLRAFVNKRALNYHSNFSLVFICFLVFFTNTVRAQHVTTYAGTLGVQGLVDGYKDTCQFGGVEQMAFDRNGNLYVADAANNVIRKIDTAGTISTYAGTPGAFGFVNGYKDTCQFNSPLGIAIDKFDNIYVADNYNHAIRKIDTAGNVTTFSGGNGNGYIDGAGSIALFNYPVYICFDDSMNLYVADNSNHAIRKIDTAGYVSTFAGSGFPGWVDANGTNAYFSLPIAITYNSLQQSFYVVDRDFCFIRKINLAGDVTTIAGTGFCGFNNGTGNTAIFNEPKGITTDSIGNIYIAGRLDHTIRKIDLQYNVSTLAGTPLTIGFQDGPAATALFNRPISVTFGPDKALYISDVFNYLIRKIDSISYVTFIPQLKSEISYTVYPNPASTNIQIAGLSFNSNYEIEILNTMGQNVLTQKFTNNNNPDLDIHVLPPGVYFIKITSGDMQGATRFIKQ